MLRRESPCGESIVTQGCCSASSTETRIAGLESSMPYSRWRHARDTCDQCGLMSGHSTPVEGFVAMCAAELAVVNGVASPAASRP